MIVTIEILQLAFLEFIPFIYWRHSAPYKSTKVFEIFPIFAWYRNLTYSKLSLEHC